MIQVIMCEKQGKRGEKMIKAYAKSDIGKVREINQDYYYISNSLDEVQLYMLADGMGAVSYTHLNR